MEKIIRRWWKDCKWSNKLFNMQCHRQEEKAKKKRIQQWKSYWMAFASNGFLFEEEKNEKKNEVKWWSGYDWAEECEEECDEDDGREWMSGYRWSDYC